MRNDPLREVDAEPLGANPCFVVTNLPDRHRLPVRARLLCPR